MKNNFETLERILSVCAKLDPELPLRYVRCLLVIGANEGISLTELKEACGLTLSTVSRVVNSLADHRQKSSEPYRLVDIKFASDSRRKKCITLTSKGRAFLKDLLSAVDG